MNKSEPRDKHGRFAKDATPPKAVAISEKPTDETLVDVHVANPLKRITQLLLEIKQQKAFSFTLKGSLGIMGVVLVASSLGIFGTSRILCGKGVQTKIGYLKVLKYKEVNNIPLIDRIPFVTRFNPPKEEVRMVLIANDSSTIHIVPKKLDITSFANTPVVVSGSFDDCAKTLDISSAAGIEKIQ